LRRILDLHSKLPAAQRPLRIQVLTDFGSAGAKFIVDSRAVAIGPLAPTAFTPAELTNVFTQYKIEDPRLQADLAVELGRSNESQEKLIKFGQMFLEKIGDWA
jgi:hypothetical protein